MVNNPRTRGKSLVVENIESSQSFLAKHEFVIRRLHSLSGLVPVGAFMTVHLLTNSSVLASPQKFQQLVYKIHDLGPILPLVEWVFIFIPLIFHAVLGVAIVRGGLPNTSSYSYSSNIRYTLQRATGMIAFVFIFWHVFHMHGWFHADGWLAFAKELGGAKFSPYDAPSSAAEAMQAFGPLIPILYATGVLACVFHLANGIWTMGITWGLWVSPAAQKRANWVSLAVGIGLSIVGLGGVAGFSLMDETTLQEAREVEEQMFKAKVDMGEVDANTHKKRHAEDHEPEDAEDGTNPE